MVVLAMINKKTGKELVASSWKNGDWVSSFSLSCILTSMLTLSSLIEIDACIKIIHIDFSHIKLLRMFPKYRFLAYL